MHVCTEAVRGESEIVCACISVSGTVQGAGMRPFIQRLATSLGLTGWVCNSAGGITVEVEGLRARVSEFVERIRVERPRTAELRSVATSFQEARGHSSFEIRESMSGAKGAVIMPDLATCADCLREVFDPSNRRYRYPFTNCTQCGPRYSILNAIPYDRCNTTMRDFRLCDECRAEYADPGDRRFHAQPIACPKCGPQLALCNPQGDRLAEGNVALLATARAIRNGQIVALKGMGGFQLLVDARSEKAVRCLRERKRRDEKPFAVMFPNSESTGLHCAISELEERWLASQQAPIVLLSRCAGSSTRIAQNVAPGNPNLGSMLPCTPLHHLLLRELNFPVVCTSGNRSGEPICINDDEAFERLNGIADAFLTHDRPIARPIDDSVLRIVMDKELILRRARGFAPAPIYVEGLRGGILAVGAHMKNAIAISLDGAAVLSQHIGDLGTLESQTAFERSVHDLQDIYELAPASIACDAHPDYDASRFAQRQMQPGVIVQHHYAHVLSCMAENGLKPPVLGVAWDGTGFGTDGTIWGGEFLNIGDIGFTRVAHFRTFGLPGGERAIEEPRRAALGVLYEMRGDSVFVSGSIPSIAAFPPGECETLRTMLARGINTPRTSSAGRLCDALVSIMGLRQRASYEGHAAMELEFALSEVTTEQAYEIELRSNPGSGPIVLDWGHMVEAVLRDRANSIPTGMLSARIHNAFVESIVGIARRANIEAVALSGGCFQNRYLTERAVRRLREEGFEPFWHRQVPPNDGGIALGQLLAASREME